MKKAKLAEWKKLSRVEKNIATLEELRKIFYPTGRTRVQKTIVKIIRKRSSKRPSR